MRLVEQNATTTVYQVCTPPEPGFHVGAHVALYLADGAFTGISRVVTSMHAPEPHSVALVLQRRAADERALLLNTSLAQGCAARLPSAGWAQERWRAPALSATYAEPDLRGPSRLSRLPAIRGKRRTPDGVRKLPIQEL